MSVELKIIEETVDTVMVNVSSILTLQQNIQTKYDKYWII